MDFALESALIEANSRKMHCKLWNWRSFGVSTICAFKNLIYLFYGVDPFTVQPVYM